MDASRQLTLVETLALQELRMLIGVQQPLAPKRLRRLTSTGKRAGGTWTRAMRAEAAVRMRRWWRQHKNGK